MTDTFAVLYVHSPITYSIARQLLAQRHVSDPLVICGRGTHWDGPHITVLDDGIWNAERVGDFLQKMLDALPSQRPLQLDIYLPHSGFLLGKLLKMSPLVRHIFYIEEGDTSHELKLTRDKDNITIPVADYAALFRRRGLLQRLGISDAMFAAINTMEAIWFDGDHPKYGGAYGVSASSFPSLNKVQRLQLDLRDELAGKEKIWVCFLPNIVSLASRYDQNQPMLQQLLYALVILLRTQSSLAASMSCSLLVKFHPVDDVNLSPEFKSEFLHNAALYSDFMRERGLDAGYEPALYGFGKYVVVNTSAASRYVTQILGPDRLVQIALD